MYTIIEKRNIKLKFLRDAEFIMSNSTQEFDWCKITIKKDTILELSYCTYGEYIPTYEFDKFYLIDVEPHDNKGIIIEVLRESDDDINNVEELRKELLFLEVNAEDVIEVK